MEILRSRTRLLYIPLLRSMPTPDGLCKMFVLHSQGIYSGSFAGRQEQLAAHATRDRDPLIEAELAALDDDGASALESLLSRLSNVPTPAGQTPVQLRGESLVQIDAAQAAD